jgi:hypothetical protein
LSREHREAYGPAAEKGVSTILPCRETVPPEAIEKEDSSATTVRASVGSEMNGEDISHSKTVTGSVADSIPITDSTIDSTMISFSETGITGLSTL